MRLWRFVHDHALLSAASVAVAVTSAARVYTEWREHGLTPDYVIEHIGEVHPEAWITLLSIIAWQRLPERGHPAAKQPEEES